ADTKGAATSQAAEPGQKEADQLPHRIDAEAARHDRIVLKVAFEKPEVRVDVEFGLDLALIGAAALFGDASNAVEHQHRRQRRLRIALAEKFAACAGEKPLQIKARFPA